MKHFSIFLFFLVCSFAAQAQNLPIEIEQTMQKIAKLTARPNEITVRNGEICLPDSVVSYSIDAVSGDSVVYEKYVYKYTPTGQIAIDSFFQNDQNTGEFGIFRIINYGYNAQNVLISELQAIKNGAGDPELQSANYYFPTGTSTNKLDSSVFWSIDFQSGMLLRTSKVENVYNSTDQLSLTTDYIYDAINGWVLNGKTEFTFKANGKLLGEINYLWNDPNWVPNTSYTLTYDANDSLSVFLITNLLTNMPQTQITYEYDLPMHIVSVIIENWDENINDWQFLFSQKVDYDNENRIGLTEDFINFGGFFTAGDQNFYNYPGNSDCVSFTNDFTSMDGINWDPLGTTYYYYNGTIISTNSLITNELGVQISPNPFAETFKIDAPIGSQIQVFSMTGKLLLATRATADFSEIDAANLPNGPYFISIKNEGRVVTKLVTKVD